MIPLKDDVRSNSFPIINILLVLANIAVFWMELRSPSPIVLERFIGRWALFSGPLLNHPWENWHRVISSMFLHEGWLHIIGNMLYLWVFGDNIEDRVGHFRYLLFYLLVGAGAALTQCYMNSSSVIPMLGASGAIAGVMGAYFVLYPRARVTVAVPIFIFIKFIEIPAILLLGFWFVFQALQGYGSLVNLAAGAKDLGGVAWWAHAGGFLAGVILIFIFRKSRKQRSFF